MNSTNRLKEVRTYLGLTQSQLGEKLGFQWHKIKDIESGKLKITPEIADELDNLYSIDPWWLLTGKGEMLNEQSNTTNLPATLQTNNIVVPRLSAICHAGSGMQIIDQVEKIGEMVLDKALFRTPPKEIFSMRVEGYSMIPMLFPDSWVVFDSIHDFKGDGLYVISWGNCLMVKLLQLTPQKNIKIISANKDYESWELSEENQTELVIFGKVLRSII